MNDAHEAPSASSWRRGAMAPVALAAACVALALWLQARIGFNLQDESFLWYGELRVLAGETPLRDFRSYDPGRYWWAAGWAGVLGDGLVALRCSTWILAGIGLAAGLCVLRRVVARPLELFVGALALLVWMFPPWKLHEPTLALIGALCATRHLEAPGVARAAQLGLWTGIAAVFARNFGVYAAVATAATLCAGAWLANDRRGLWRNALACAAGVVAGYSPVLLALVFVDGFAGAFADSVLFYLRQDSLNAVLPVPWPWRAELAGLSWRQGASVLAVGVGFVALWAAPALALVAGARSSAADASRRSAAVGCALVALCCSHHASVRSDVFHLAQVFGSAALALVAGASLARSPWPRRIALAAILVLGAFATGVRQPVWKTMGEPLVEVELRGSKVALTAVEAESLRGLRALVESHVRPSEDIWIGPRFLGLYCVLDRRAPTWEIYPAFRGDEAEQRRMLEELREVEWILHDARPIGRDEEMVLERSHPEVWRAIQRDYEPAPVKGLPANLLFLRRRS
jgi:hypothetical protein